MNHIVVSYLAALLVAWPAPAQAGAETNPEAICEVMKEELDRNMEKLKLPDYPRPYFISYLMRDHRSRGVTARYGAPVFRKQDHQRSVGADVRVGSFEMDNTLDRFAGFDMPFSFQPFRDRAPLEDNHLALRKVLWKATDAVFKQAVASFLKVKAQRVYQAADPEFAGCFSKAPVARHMDEPKVFVEEMKGYEKTVVTLSKLLTDYDHIHDSWVSFDAARSDRYFVNSEGSIVYTSDSYFSYSVQAFSRADDGTVVPHSLVLYAREMEDLPGSKQLQRQVRQMAEQLALLRAAPLLQPYSGPTLLEGDTAGVFMHEALGHRLEGHRQHGMEEGSTFSGKVDDKILPDIISIEDDPTLARFDKQSINGHYTYDDEGVAAQSVTLVDKGTLAGFLLTRRPVQQFKQSNGHARASGNQRPVARMGTLILKASKTEAHEELKRRLLQLARDQGKPFALILRNAASGATNTSSWGFQAFKGVARLVYQVDLETGNEKLVRGVELVGTPLASLMKIVAVGNDPALFNGYCGAESGFVPVSTITPSLLMRELEFQKAPPLREQKEILPSPR